MDYEIDLSALESKKSDLEELKQKGEDIYNEFNSSYLGSLQSTELINLKAIIKAPIDRLKKGLANCNTWFSDYITELTALEDSLAAFSAGSLTAPTEFSGEFTDMFGKVTIPTLKTGGDPHANASPVQKIANDGTLIVSSESGYVFPFAKGVSAPITSHVGLRDAPIAGASSDHHGTDIGVSYGTEIHSIASGTVINAGRSDAGGFGNWVKIRQDDGNVVIYGHVSKSDYFSVGDRVEAGDVIANVGSEGISTGPHLHLEMHDANGNLLDSENYFADCWPN